MLLGCVPGIQPCRGEESSLLSAAGGLICSLMAPSGICHQKFPSSLILKWAEKSSNPLSLDKAALPMG